MFKVINSYTHETVEVHKTKDNADKAVLWLNEHEQAWAAKVAAGDQLAAAADRPGRPYSYAVLE